MRTPLIRVGAAMVGALMVLLVALPLTASAETATKVPNGDEAWFLAKKEVLAEPTGEDPTCEIEQTGCNLSGQAQRPSPHPENTLVVAANSGDPDAQTFINFDTAALPFGAVVTGGSVTLPVARDPDARNLNEGEATLQACMVTGFIPGGADGGSYQDRPAFDEKTCVDVKQETPEPLVFTVDLERFGKVWSADPTAMQGITLKVHEDIAPPAPQETWRVVFNTNRRAQQGTEEQKSQPEEARVEYPAIEWTLNYRVEKLDLPDFGGGGDIPGPNSGNPFPTTDTSTSSGGGFEQGSFESGTDSGSTDFGTSAPPATSGAVIDPPMDSGTTAEEPPLAAAPATTTAQPVAAGPATPVSAPGTSPAVWILPLIALVMAGAMAYSLMQPVELVGNREGAVSKLMRGRRLAAQTPSPTA